LKSRYLNLASETRTDDADPNDFFHI